MMPAWLRVFSSWRIAMVLMLGFASGLPLALTGQALQAWMGVEGIDLEVIGIVSLVALPYALKFLWSPLMDRFVPPLMGRRRGWILVCQIALIFAILGMAATGVSGGISLFAVLATLVAFCSASQDIAIDAYRTDLLEPAETGAGAAAAIMGWRIGFICSGAVALMLADLLSWRVVYVMMAGAMAITAAVTLLAPEPQTGVKPPSSFAQAVVEPFREFLSRPGAWQMLLFILIYKLDWAMVYWATTPFLQTALHFTQAQIGAANTLGVVLTIAGATIGGSVLAQIGLRKALLVFGLLQGLAGASFAVLAIIGHNYAMLATAVSIENFCSGMATAAFTGFLMTICDKRFSATQYALLSSIFALSRTGVGAAGGWLANSVGWPMFFVISIVLALPGLLLLMRFSSWGMPAPVKAPAAQPEEQLASAGH